MEVRRQSSSSRRHFFKTMTQEMAAADTIIQENDILYVLGDFTNVERFAEENTLKLLDTHEVEGAVESKSDELEFTEIGIAEIVLMPASNLVNKPVKDSGFREKYGVNILGIQRKRQYILKNLKDEKMHSGDALLVQGTWENIARLSEDPSDWVVLEFVVGRPDSKISVGSDQRYGRCTQSDILTRFKQVSCLHIACEAN